MSVKAIIFILLIPFMSTGNTFPTSGVNDTSIGATAWTNPGNITADDNATASNTAAASTQYLVAKTFGFSLPQNAKIIGVTVRIAAAETSTGSETLFAQLQSGAVPALVGSSKSQSINGTGETIYTYGSTTDTWGATLTTVDINHINFGVRFWYTTSHNMTVDYVTMSVDYALGGGFFRAQNQAQ